jgi:predicted phage tail protein
MLNKFFLSCQSTFKASLAFIFFALLIAGLSCGKRKPPLPPVEKIVQRVEISGNQRGNLIILSWNLPAQNASENNILNIARADIYRLAEPVNAPLTLSEEEFASRSTLISTIRISDEDFRRKQLNFSDTLELAGQNARLRYAVRFVNSSGQKAAFSNFLLIEPSPNVAASPTLLIGKISEETIDLIWQSPGNNIDDSEPANILGYNIYRINLADNTEKILNNNPITNNSFSDRFFEFGISYRYFVRTVSLGSNGEPVESLNSNIVELKPLDVFAPNPPSAITIAAAPNNLSIFFAVNSEKDIAGYRIYRSVNPKQPLSEWTPITTELLTTNTFQDKNVKSGEIYYYYLTAVDKVGNESGASVIVSEIAP